MYIITFTTDFGGDNLYIAALKAQILKINPEATFIDINNNINDFDINEAALVSKMSYKNFPENTIHLVLAGTNTTKKSNENHIRLLLANIENQWFIAPDNGILSLYFEIDKYNVFAFEKQNTESSLSKLSCTAIKQIYANDIQSELLSNEYVKLKLFEPEIHNNILISQIVFIDKFGNAFVNFTKSMREKIGIDKALTVHTQRRSTENIYLCNHYNDVEEGEVLCFFNDFGYLQISVNGGNAYQLLGLRRYENVVIRIQS